MPDWDVQPVATPARGTTSRISCELPIDLVERLNGQARGMGVGRAHLIASAVEGLVRQFEAIDAGRDDADVSPGTYYDGVRDALRWHAVHRNGEQWVGAGLHTLGEALEWVDEAEAEGRPYGERGQ